MSQKPNTPAELRHVKNLQIHRLSGAWIFLIDNFFFVGNAMTAGLATPLSCVLAFITGGVGVFLIQKLLNKDSTGQAFLRGLVAGVLAGIPISIAGTVYGGWVKVMLFTVVPAGFIGFIPVSLLREFDGVQLAALVGGTATYAGIAAGVFALGRRRYESGNQIGVRT